MAYLIKKTWNNGYRCCCHNSWEDTKWEDSLEKALTHVPKEFFRYEVTDTELENVTATDGTTGEIVAQASLEYPHYRGYMYNTQRWSGLILGEPFEEIRGGKEGETWDQLINRVTEEIDRGKLKQLEDQKKAIEDKIKSLEKV